MTLREKEIFVAVVEEGRIGSAAKRLRIAQPTVSSTIRRLEENSQRPLFNHYQRRLLVTATGEDLYRLCKQALSLEGKMDRLLQESRATEPIRVGASQTIGNAFFCRMMKQAEQKYKKADLHVVVDNSDVVEEGIVQGDLDFGFIERPPQSGLVVWQAVHEDELVVVCSKETDLAPNGSFSIQDIDGCDFIHREQGSGTRQLVEEIATQSGIRLREKWTCHSNEAVLHAVAGGLGLSILSKSLLVQQSDVRGYAIDRSLAQRRFYRILHQDKELSVQQERLLHDLEEGFSELDESVTVRRGTK